MTAKEIFDKRIEIGTLSRDYGHTVDDVLHIDNANELDTIEQALTELEELKNDVKRYFGLRSLPDDKYTTEVSRECVRLELKLWKVGKEEGEVER